MAKQLMFLLFIVATTVRALSQTDEKVDAMLSADFVTSSLGGQYDRWLKPDGTYYEFRGHFFGPVTGDQTFTGRTGTYRAVRSVSDSKLLDLYFDGVRSTTLNFANHTGSGWTSFTFTWKERADGDAIPNTSTRTYVTPGHPAIAGFVITGSQSRLVLVRAVGAGLRTFNVTDAVASTQLALYKGSTSRASASGRNQTTAVAEDDLARIVGAFPLKDPSETVLMTTLEPGAYTVQAASADGAQSGTVLTEVYFSTYIEK